MPDRRAISGHRGDCQVTSCKPIARASLWGITVAQSLGPMVLSFTSCYLQTMKTILCLLATLMASAPALSAQAVSPQTLAGLRARDIGPATMSGRVVDLAVV